MSVNHATLTRRTFIKWRKDPVSPEVFTKIIDAAFCERGSCNLQLKDFVLAMTWT